MVKLPVLFLPGTLCTPAVFRHQVNELSAYAPRTETVRFTTQQSIAAMAKLAIEHIPPSQSAAIVGFSMGGMVALEICRMAPQRVAKLALLSTNCHPDLPERKAGREQLMKRTTELGMEHAIRNHYLPNCLHNANPGAETLLLDMALELGMESYLAQSLALATRRDATPVLATIQSPTLILGGTQDKLCGPDTQDTIHQGIENSRLLLLEDCGHFSMLEQPEQVNASLLDWYLGA